VGNLPQPVDVMELLRQVKEHTGTGSIRHTAHAPRMVQRIALCGGAGSSLIQRAAAAGAELFITGEIGYHQFFGYENDLILAEIGHYESEQHTKEIFCEVITKKFPNFATYYANVETNPIKYL
jgi:putative NIF3 family GTP cyclohydrolase 1 type 2